VHEWDPDVVVDEALVGALLSEQFPEFDASSARLLGEGFDNSVWVVEEGWAFRFPRREIAVPGVEREIAILPRLAPLLPVPIPVPQYVGRPSVELPWRFFGAALLAGCEPADAEEFDRREIGASLGRFLRVLHAPRVLDAVDPERALPADPMGRADPAKRVPLAQQALADLASLGVRHPDVSVVLDESLLLPPPVDAVLLHGDLHLRHVLVEGGALSGVIDWGDACLGDPSVDLQIAWSLLSDDDRVRFLDEYGPVGEERRLRARMLAVGLCAMLAKYARSVGNAGLLRESLAGLERTLIE
jgi:aminoglycoside phosphotransferase (APT) family kinase protein